MAAKLEVLRDDPREAWANPRCYASDIRVAFDAGRLAWDFGAECQYPDGHPLRKAWGRGYNAARFHTSLSASDVIHEYRHSRELVE